jgi:predicted DNA-binding transcriptional regulator YafY
VRVFRLDRVLAATVQEATFTRPSDFDSLQFLLESFATAPWGFPIEVILETTMEDARRRFHPGTAVFEEAPEGVLVRTQVERLEWAARALLMLGCPFVVRQPQELRQALRALAAEALTMADRGG